MSGVLGVLDGALEIPEVDLQHGGAFSVVLDTSNDKRRRLPALYVGTVQVFADREIGRVAERLLEAVAALLTSSSRPLYALQGVEIAGRKGLYGRDFFNRAPFRRKLARQGATFSSSGHIELLPSGEVEVPDWGLIDPTFVILDNPADDPEEVTEIRGAFLRFILGSFRIGKLDPRELTALAAMSEGVQAVGAGDAAALVSYLTD